MGVHSVPRRALARSRILSDHICRPVSLFADLFYYIIGIAAALGLRKRHPELGRPYKAPLIEVGVPVSILIYAIMLFQLDRYAIVSGIIWCVVGLVVYYICHAKYGDSNILNINDSITDEASLPGGTCKNGQGIPPVEEHRSRILYYRGSAVRHSLIF